MQVGESALLFTGAGSDEPFISRLRLDGLPRHQRLMLLHIGVPRNIRPDAAQARLVSRHRRHDATDVVLQDPFARIAYPETEHAQLVDQQGA